MNEKPANRVLKTSILVLLMTVLCLAFAMTASAETVGGNCEKNGDNVTWSLDTETGVLTIAGEGEMEDHAGVTENSYCSTGKPWGSYEVKTVIISNGVTSVGNGSFSEEEIQEVYIADTVKNIGFFCFSSLQKLEKRNHRQ